MTDLENKINTMGQRAKQAASHLSGLESSLKNDVLKFLAKTIDARREQIIIENKKDLSAAKDKGISDAMIDRLELDDKRIDDIINGINQVALLDDPVGEMSGFKKQASGIKIGKMRIPIGVIGMIYESRPNVTIDASILCFKSGNAVILRGGSEAFHSNQILVECFKSALEKFDLDTNIVQYIDSTDREAVSILIKLSKYVDVIIPRGGKSLVSRIDSEARVPVIKHLDGVCHVYIDSDADIEKSINVALNAKTRRYGVCGAMETLLIHKDIATQVLPKLAQQYQQKGVELIVCHQTKQILDKENIITSDANESDWSEEYLAAKLSIKITDNIDEAINHINVYGSHHTDAIMTEKIAHANLFMQKIDSSSVMVNASTQFADGYEYGLGAEIGISTNKLHVRGPVGLEGLTTLKYIVLGEGHTRA